MVRVSRHHVVISLPDARPVWQYRFHVSKCGTRSLLLSRPILKQPEHVFDGEHHWEINKKGYGLGRVIKDFGRLCHLTRTYRVFENPYHRFFVFQQGAIKRSL